MSKTGRTLLALVGAAVVLVVMAWFDSTVMTGRVRDAAATFDPTVMTTALALGSLLVAGAVLLVATLAWWARSAIVSLAYVIVGGFFVLLPWIVWTLAVQENDVPPVLPEPLAVAVSNVHLSTTGPLYAVGTVGAAMVIAAIATTVRSWRGRAVTASGMGVADPTRQATLP
jgi:hypothetical protein